MIGEAIGCYYHPDAYLIDDDRAGDVICSECGLVVGDRVIDVGQEWRTFDNQDRGGNRSDPCRVGGPDHPLMPNDLSTLIAGGRGPAAFEDDGKTKYSAKSTLTAGEKRMIAAVKEIENMAERLNLSQSVRDCANTMYKMAVDRKLIKGRKADVVGAACILIACRQEGVPRTFKEICAVCNSSVKEIGHVFKILVKQMATTVGITTTDDLMSRFCANLKLSKSVQRAATIIARQADNLNLVGGRSPVSVAAAAIFMASQAADIKKSAKEIGDICGVADVTIRKVYQIILPEAAQLIPRDFVVVIPIRQLPSA